MNFLLSALIAIASIGGIDATGNPKCDVEPLDIFKAEKGYNSYDGVTYSSALQEWTSSILELEYPEDGPVHYIFGSYGGYVQHVPEGKYIFVRVGGFSAWLMGASDNDRRNLHQAYKYRDPLFFIEHVTQKKLNAYSDYSMRLAASVAGSTEIPYFSKRKVNCTINGCKVNRCEDYLVFTDTFGPVGFLGSDFDHARAHGFFFLLSNDLEPGLYTIESDRELNHFLLPYSTPLAGGASSTYNICVGDHESCYGEHLLRRKLDDEDPNIDPDTACVEDADGKTCHVCTT